MGYDVDYYLWGHDPEPMAKAEFVDYTNDMKAIGALVERMGNQREHILQALPATIDRALNEEHIELVDAFLAGLQR